MYDGILNNRMHWKARQEEYEAKLKEMEEAVKAKQEAAANNGLNFRYSLFSKLLFSCILIFVYCICTKFDETYKQTLL